MVDIPNDATTTAEVPVGFSFTGEFETFNDSDWIRVGMSSGQTYTVHAHASASGGASGNVAVNLRNAAGTIVASSLGTGVGLNDILTFTPSFGGNFFLEVLSAGAGDPGAYGIYFTSQGTGNPPLVDRLLTVFADNYTGQNGEQRLLGGLGADTIVLGPTASEVLGEQGDDLLIGSDTLTFARLIGGLGDDTLLGGISNERLYGDAGLDHLEGGGGNDFLLGGEGADQIFGGDGFDQLFGGPGADLLDGGASQDSASYLASPAGVQIDLLTGIGTGGEAEGDQLAAIEAISGSELADVLRGSDGDDFLTGFGGNDVLRGRGGSDRLNGGNGIDTATWSESPVGVVLSLLVTTPQGGDTLLDIENLIGTNQADSLTGDTEANSLRGASGDDVLAGGIGDDTLRGDAGLDDLNGGGGKDLLEGHDGDDQLDGGADNDVLRGGLGKDRLVAGSGADFCDYDATAESPTGAGRDLIVDFKPAADHIDLSTIDANSAAGGNQAFTFIGTALFTGVAGQLRYNAGGVVQGDTNGDGLADFHIQVAAGLVLSATDFVL